ncbi:hypothetical protein Tco_0581483 [Tanacetum coccineum]
MHNIHRWKVKHLDETTGPSVHLRVLHPQRLFRETLYSCRNAESWVNFRKDNSGRDTEIKMLVTNKVGLNSEQSHVALAGPNPEHMQDIFLATNYPKIATRFSFEGKIVVLQTAVPNNGQKKLRNQISSALTASADVPSRVTETTDTTSTLQLPRPPLQTYSSSRYLVER